MSILTSCNNGSVSSACSTELGCFTHPLKKIRTVICFTNTLRTVFMAFPFEHPHLSWKRMPFSCKFLIMQNYITSIKKDVFFDLPCSDFLNTMFTHSLANNSPLISLRYLETKTKRECTQPRVLNTVPCFRNGDC